LSSNICIALTFVGFGISLIHLFRVDCTNFITDVYCLGCIERVLYINSVFQGQFNLESALRS